MTGSDATVLELDIPAARPADAPQLQFRIRYGPEPDEVDDFLLNPPKVTVAIGLLDLLDENGIGAMSVGQAGVKVAEALWGVVSYVEEQPPQPMLVGPDDNPRANPLAGRLRGQARLLQRLRSAKDSMDVIDLLPVFERAIRAMFDRPTGPLAGSSPRPASGGTGSVVGSSEPQDATAGS